MVHKSAGVWHNMWWWDLAGGLELVVLMQGA
jgi:hypothetical protein